MKGHNRTLNFRKASLGRHARSLFVAISEFGMDSFPVRIRRLKSRFAKHNRSKTPVDAGAGRVHILPRIAGRTFHRPLQKTLGN